MLRDGQVAEQGSHEELLAIEDGVYRRLWEAQLTENTQVKEGNGNGAAKAVEGA